MPTRRQALQIGGLATLGLSLPEVIVADDRHPAPGRQKHAKSCILFFMEGGDKPIIQPTFTHNAQNVNYFKHTIISVFKFR